jgi:hypothetical protein
MRAVLPLLMLIAITGCGGSSEGAPPANYIEDPPLWNDYQVGYRETINLAEFVGVEFQEVEEDTRCPVDAQCITPGNARIRIKATTPRGDTILWLNTNPALQTSTYFDYYGIELRKLEPSPTLDPQTGTAKPIPIASYVATVFVIKAATPQ